LLSARPRLLQLGEGVWHQRQPLLHEHVLEPGRGEPFDRLRHFSAVLALRYTATVAKGVNEPAVGLAEVGREVEERGPEEERPRLLGQHRNVAGWERIAARCRVVVEVTGSGHAPQPLANVPLLQPSPGGELVAGRRTIGGQLLEESEPVADARHEEGVGTGVVAKNPLRECLHCCLLEHAGCLSRHLATPVLAWPTQIEVPRGPGQPLRTPRPSPGCGGMASRGHLSQRSGDSPRAARRRLCKV
jgi:hypothetical protein